VMVTHDPRVLPYGDRILHLEDGRLAREESPSLPARAAATLPDAIPAESGQGALS
jgi:putative ABC transport system ATP-binding protein